MADNSTRLDAGSATETVASDDIGGVKHQRMKLEVGADGVAVDVQPPDADGIASSRNLPAGGLVWNGASFDRQRGNTEGNLLASAARTATAVSASQTNYNARGVIVYLNITAASGTGGLQVAIQGISAGAGYLLNPFPTAIVATGAYGYEVYPGDGAASGSTAGNIVQRTSGVLPRTWQVTVIHGNATSYTYQVDYALIV